MSFLRINEDEQKDDLTIFSVRRLSYKLSADCHTNRKNSSREKKCSKILQPPLIFKQHDPVLEYNNV